jgi:sulfate adenylyltransferase
VSLKDRKHFLREAASLPPVRVSRADLSTVYRIADGALSPLEGPMKQAVWRRALEEAVIEAGGKRYAGASRWRSR